MGQSVVPHLLTLTTFLRQRENYLIQIQIFLCSTNVRDPKRRDEVLKNYLGIITANPIAQPEKKKK